MFYSHEVLTSRKYGVATVWLVATLGSKSALKKVTRKAILDVDVQRACDTIEAPEAPMALRLQSNLLYGVTRVYAQQVGYVLADAEGARNAMRMLLRSMNVKAAGGIDGVGCKGRADQLMLQDDPNFLPDLDLMSMDIDPLDLDLTQVESSQRSTLSPAKSSQRPGGSQQTPIDLQDDVGGLVIPGSASSFVGGAAGGFSGGLSGYGSARRNKDEGVLLDDDLGLMIGDDGALLDEPVARQTTAIPASGERDGGSEVASKARSQLGEDQEMTDQLDGGFMPAADEYTFVSDPQQNAQQASENTDMHQHEETSEETATAPLRRRPKTTAKVIPLDSTMELHNSDLARWSKEYLTNMEAALRPKNAGKAVAQAKKNAEFWMLGQSDAGPLSMFQGVRFLEALTGLDLSEGGQKRPRDEGYETDETRRKRSRTGEASSDELARGMEYDEGFMMAGDDTIEQGREAPTPLDDRHLSSMMPWNQSAGSRRPTALFSGTGQQQHPTSASMGPGGMQLTFPARRGSRLTSASPLQGRGISDPVGDIDDFQLPGSQAAGDIGMSDTDAFEQYGAAANVDTQTAAQSQWQRAALDGESENFLHFVEAGIEELEQGGDDEASGSVEFETLLPPTSNTCVVAAQALLHVLALGTKHLLKVEQDEAFGPISLRPFASV